MKVITEAGELQGKRVFVRVDWNVPIQDGKVVDTFRIDQSLPTIQFLLEQGAKVTIATHLEEGGVESLQGFVPTGAELLPNLRENAGEKENSEEFARTLAAQADVYVNEAFSVSHRNHASIVSLPKLLPSFAGIHFAQEVRELSKAFKPTHPFLILLGGAKIETKLPLVQKFAQTADSIFIGGAMAVRASEMKLDSDPKIFFPIGDLAALDANAETLEVLKNKINESKLIIWNGPLGKYEAGYTQYTNELAMALAESGAEVIVGGGDTLATIKALNIFNKFSFVSTGGGAMLDFLASETLPGIEALK